MTTVRIENDPAVEAAMIESRSMWSRPLEAQQHADGTSGGLRHLSMPRDDTDMNGRAEVEEASWT